ncbi:hypothetical protein [Allochromatium vinosum]|uniref:Uncharacterized protein n=1 Tax=Allochromatium vinosum (strain ATCC 17899 / DSM 180 / NBRC 103801 / NCIMB 10441 / D) TaxID=572477 RepID=D3RP53_ALLVD|nr:hypothetical protein [Allochromatium vinosum]ADC63443.1 conserved hypothetical protein [Allochromatium vinosum DSM 180]
MEATNESLFQLMRFNILNSGRSDLDNSPFTSAYIYAWESGVFPAFNEAADWHKPFSEQFDVTEEEVLALGKLLDEKWLAKTPITFYELEAHCGVRGSTYSSVSWNRAKLVVTCRYMYLNRMFDDSFWSALVKNGECPSEAHSICMPLKQSDIYFM